MRSRLLRTVEATPGQQAFLAPRARPPQDSAQSDQKAPPSTHSCDGSQDTEAARDQVRPGLW